LRIGVKRRRVSAWTRREVVEKLDALRALTESGQPLGKDIRVGEWFDWYIDVVVAHQSANTAASYKWAFRQCAPLRGHRLSELEIGHVEDLFAELAREKPQSIQKKG
jgi:hypothetical protein